MKYPRFVFRNGGLVERAGGTYSQEIVKGENEHRAALVAGWFDSIQDAIDAKQESEFPGSGSDEMPTREEMKRQIESLGLKFDGRMSDKNILAMIDLAMRSERAIY